MHFSSLAKDVFREFYWEILPHAPYNLNLVSSDVFLFPKLNKHLKGAKADSIMHAKTTTQGGSSHNALTSKQNDIKR